MPTSGVQERTFVSVNFNIGSMGESSIAVGCNSSKRTRSPQPNMQIVCKLSPIILGYYKYSMEGGGVKVSFLPGVHPHGCKDFVSHFKVCLL